MSQTKAQLIDPVDGTIVNADINASAAIAGSKISPDFGSQAISTTGGLSINGATVFNESGANVDFRVEGDTEPNLLFVDASADQVSIGTSSPSDVFDVVHAGNTAAGISIRNTNNSQGSAFAQLLVSGGDNAKGRVKIEANGAFHTIDEDNNGNLIIEDNGTEALRIDSSRRFLLNMSSSVTGGKFQVNNQFSTFFAATNDSTGCVLQLEKTRSTSPGSYTIVQDGDKLGELQFKGSNGSASVIGANIQAVVNGTPGSGNDLPTDLIFRTMPDGSGSTIKRMRIQEDGKVVIGSGTPDYQTGNMTSGAVGINVTGTAPQVLLHNTNDDKDAYLGIVGSNLFLFSADSIPIVFGNGDAEQMRIDTSGRLLIGTSSSVGGIASHLQVVESDGGKLAFARNDTTVSAGADIGMIQCFGNDNDGNYQEVAAIRLQADKNHGNNDKPGRIVFLTTADGGSSATERMRLTSSGAGQLIVGNTVEPTNGASGIMIQGNGFFALGYAGTGLSNMFEFNNANGQIGKIVGNGSNTTYTTSSDYRLKENASAISDGITRLKNLKPYRFNFKTQPSVTQDGFFAHEVTPVVPEAVVGEKDATKEDGSINPQGIDQGRIVPLLVAAVKELITKVETLEAA